jgi:hypothetical protein
MGDHYVPRLYLRGFCEPGSDHELWQYDKVRDDFRRVSVTTAANEAGFYSADVERQLAQLVEGPANAVICKLRAGHGIDDVERARLAVYMGTMIKRVPQHRLRAQKLLPQVVQETLANVREVIAQAAESGVLSPEMEARRRGELAAVEGRMAKGTPHEIMEQIRRPWPGLELVNLIYDMAWRFVITTGPSFFLTSDNPVFFFEGLGLKRDTAELVFPIASHLALHGSWQDLAPGEKDARTGPQHVVKEFNRRVASAATRFVFYREKRDWVREIARNQTPTIHQISWE